MDQKYTLWKPASKTLPRDDAYLKQMGMEIAQRAGDTISTSPIVAQRLEPEVMPVFVRDFPFYDLIEKVPSNGVSHTFLQQTAHTQSPDPHTMSETGTVQNDSNVYLRKTTNIAQIALQRGVTLKAGFAGAAAGGPSNNLMAREVEGGLITIARDAQMEFLRYQESDNTSLTATAANGKFDANGVNGLRFVANTMSPPENSAIVDIRTIWTDQRVLVQVRQIVANIIDKGGRPDLIVASTAGEEALFKDQMELVRYIKEASRQQITPGLNVRAVSTAAGELPVLMVPGNHIGTWVDGTGAIYSDIFICQTETLEIPYLGAPEPTIIRIPIGVNGQLSELAIPFVLLGLACKAPQYLGRVSCRIG